MGSSSEPSTAGGTATKTRAYAAEESEDKPKFTPGRRQCRVLRASLQVSQCCLPTAFHQVAGRLTWDPEHPRCISMAQEVKPVTTLVVCFTRCDDCCIFTTPHPFPCYENTYMEDISTLYTGRAIWHIWVGIHPTPATNSCAHSLSIFLFLAYCILRQIPVVASPYPCQRIDR